MINHRRGRRSAQLHAEVPSKGQHPPYQYRLGRRPLREIRVQSFVDLESRSIDILLH
jgi:hypothetical protein